MLNLSQYNKPETEKLNQFKTIQDLKNRPHYKILNKILIGFLVFGILILFLPWTQNISGQGAVTTLKPNQRPQTIQSLISGRIEKWYIQEGDFVKKGDTIVFISEIKEDYLDPNLVENTKAQMNAKNALFHPTAKKYPHCLIKLTPLIQSEN